LDRALKTRIYDQQILLVLKNKFAILTFSSSSSLYIFHGVGPLVDPFPVSRIQKSLQRSNMIPSASWGVENNMLSFKENLSIFFQWDLPVVKISPEWVTGPEQGKSSGRIATFIL